MSSKRPQPGSSLGITHNGVTGLVEQIERGLPWKTLQRFRDNSGLDLETIGRSIQLPARTMARRRAQGRLSRHESERLWRLSVVFDKAVGLFGGDVPAARDWLSRPQRALLGRTPLEFAESEVGAREVEKVIGRLEHGVFM